MRHRSGRLRESPKVSLQPKKDTLIATARSISSIPKTRCGGCNWRKGRSNALELIYL